MSIKLIFLIVLAIIIVLVFAFLLMNLFLGFQPNLRIAYTIFAELLQPSLIIPADFGNNSKSVCEVSVIYSEALLCGNTLDQAHILEYVI